jgi:hypothetical protein
MSRVLPIAFSFVLALSNAFAEPSDGGASISVQVTDGGDTTISVSRGELRLTAAGAETRLSSGQGAEVRRGQPPRKISLLPIPDRLLPPDGEHLPTVDVAFSWAPVTGAHRYRLTVASDAHFRSVVHDRTDAPSERAPVHLAAGTYYWRVCAVDQEGLEGRSTSARKLVIDITPPRLKPGKPLWK